MLTVKIKNVLRNVVTNGESYAGDREVALDALLEDAQVGEQSVVLYYGANSYGTIPAGNLTISQKQFGYLLASTRHKGKIQGIKYLREITKSGLWEAKTACENNSEWIAEEKVLRQCPISINTRDE